MSSSVSDWHNLETQEMRRGRPSLPKGESKAVMLSLRLQPAEMKKLEREAAAEKMSVSDYVRKRLAEPSAKTVREFVAHSERLARRVMDAEKELAELKRKY